MPDLSGEQLAEEVHKIRPDMPLILCTGYNTYIADQKSRDSGIRDILIKPVPSGDLAEAVRTVLDSSKQED
jgi:DNA-binding NtrC family response regulator